MTLRSRLVLGLLTIAIILVIPLLIAVQAMDRLHRDARALRDKEFAASLLLGRLRDGLNDLRRAETALLFVHDARTRDVMEKRIDTVARIADSLKTFNLEKSGNDIGRSIDSIQAEGCWMSKETFVGVPGDTGLVGSKPCRWKVRAAPTVGALTPEPDEEEPQPVAARATAAHAKGRASVIDGRR